MLSSVLGMNGSLDTRAGKSRLGCCSWRPLTLALASSARISAAILAAATSR